MECLFLRLNDLKQTDCSADSSRPVAPSHCAIHPMAEIFGEAVAKPSLTKAIRSPSKRGSPRLDT
jgi:hypothetical protein